MGPSKNSRSIWIYRGLVFIGCALMVVSAVLPWWTFRISVSLGGAEDPPPVNIYQWGLRHSLVELHEYIVADETPRYQTILAWAYIGVSVVLALWSTWIRGKKGRLLLGAVGAGYVAYAAIAVLVVITNRFQEVGMTLGGTGFSLQGWNSFIMDDFISVTIYSTLRPGYYLAYAAGGVFLALAATGYFIMDRRAKNSTLPQPGDPDSLPAADTYKNAEVKPLDKQLAYGISGFRQLRVATSRD